MYRVLIADDNSEDRELLKKEIQRALSGTEGDISFHEAVSVSQAFSLLKSQPYDLLTLDIQFDRINEGLEALPVIFEGYPALSILVISGQLKKAEVMEDLFKFTKDNVLKAKRWARHFDVLDKKDDKSDAIRRAHGFAFKQADALDKVRELLLQAEMHISKNEIDKCLDIYEKIQSLSPGEQESSENIRIFRGAGAFAQAQDYLRKGERLVAALLLGYFIESRLKDFAKKILNRSIAGLYDCLKELDHAGRIGQYKKSLFSNLIKLRNKAVHKPSTIGETDFEDALRDLKMLEADF